MPPPRTHRQDGHRQEGDDKDGRDAFHTGRQRKQHLICMKTHLWKLSASELARKDASGETSALEVIENHLRRIELVNSKVNGIVNLLAGSALKAAKEVDRRRAAGETLGALAGVPFTIKENIDVAGSATTNGVPALRHAVATRDAPVVQRLRDAGAIPIGRTNLPDLSMRFHTRSQLYGDRCVSRRASNACCRQPPSGRAGYR